LRTNQFNMTTVRLQPDDVRRMSQELGVTVIAVRSGDRFGDHGLVGTIFLRQDGDQLRIENFLLSCRVFSRGVEQTCIDAVLGLARDRGVREVIAGYRRSAKNGKLEKFYPNSGFALLDSDGSSSTFRHDLTDLPGRPSYVTLTAQLGEPESDTPNESDTPSVPDTPSGSDRTSALEGNPS
jgi:predicted enzyme involved in methoxymalonyl-ACP biosynthesis